MSSFSSRSRLAMRASILALAIAAGSAGLAYAQVQSVNIPAGSLDGALKALAAQTGQQILYSPELVAGRRSDALAGQLTPEAAVTRLARDPSLEVSRVGPNVLALKRRKPGPASRDVAGPFVGEADTPSAAAPAAPEATPTRTPATPLGEPTLLEEVRVTGTNLRGVREGPSPVLELGRDDLDRLGRPTLAGALNALPQAFGGVSTEGTLTTGADRLGSNSTYATGINLRGLGSDATLVLVNGRRLAGSGAKGDFVDISTIPTAAVERVEILLDGASALYGSDAVGGVVNVILKRRFEGVELRAFSGVGTRGEPEEYNVGLTWGETWRSGSVLGSYEYSDRSRLRAEDRPWTASPDLRSRGGTDWRSFLSHPGNVLRTDPATGVTAPSWGIPPNQTGTNLRPGDFRAGDINRENQRAGIDTLPRQRRHSAYIALRQDLTPDIALSADARYGYRRFKLDNGYAAAQLTVTRANPFFVSPNGAASNQIAYSFREDLPPGQISGSAETLALSAGAEAGLSGDWTLDGYLAFAQEIDEARSSGQLNSTALSEALGTTADRPDTAFSAARDGFFNPYGDGSVNRPGVLAFIGAGFTSNRSRDRVASANLQLDGTLFNLPAGPLKVALGAQGRRETFRRGGANFLSGVAPTPIAALDVNRSVIAGFAELRAPLVADGGGLVRRLELSLAGRLERYSDFGTTFNPKAGVIWSPTSGVLVRASVGRAFRAPALRELRDAEIYSTSQFPLGAGRVTTLVLNGGNPDLKPETATSWTAGVEYRPDGAPFHLALNWFDIRFKDRIDQPVRRNILAALTDPTVAAFVQRISPGSNPADLALIRGYLSDPRALASAFPPEAYGAIVDTRFVNTAVLRVSGFDASASYRFDVAGGRVTLQADASYLYDYAQQLTPTSSRADAVGQVGFPVKMRARLTSEWRRDAISLLVAANLVGPSRAPDGERVRRQATFDLQARYAPDKGPLADTELTLGVRNLFDRSPPFYDNPAGIAFDPANADPVGRFVSLQLTRRW